MRTVDSSPSSPAAYISGSNSSGRRPRRTESCSGSAGAVAAPRSTRSAPPRHPRVRIDDSLATPHSSRHRAAASGRRRRGRSPRRARTSFRTVAEFGSLDHLVTSAGGPPTKLFVETTDEEWYDAFDLPAVSVVEGVRAAEPRLRADGAGRSSPSRRSPRRSRRATSCSRTRSARARSDWRRRSRKRSRRRSAPTRCCRAPTGPPASRTSSSRVSSAATTTRTTRGSKSGPTGRLGDPTELGRTVAFRSSSQSAFLSGVAVPVDGGRDRLDALIPGTLTVHRGRNRRTNKVLVPDPVPGLARRCPGVSHRSSGAVPSASKIHYASKQL